MVSPIALIRKLLAAVFGAPAHAQTWIRRTATA